MNHFGFTELYCTACAFTFNSETIKKVSCIETVKMKLVCFTSVVVPNILIRLGMASGNPGYTA